MLRSRIWDWSQVSSGFSGIWWVYFLSGDMHTAIYVQEQVMFKITDQKIKSLFIRDHIKLVVQIIREKGKTMQWPCRALDSSWGYLYVKEIHFAVTDILKQRLTQASKQCSLRAEKKEPIWRRWKLWELRFSRVLVSNVNQSRMTIHMYSYSHWRHTLIYQALLCSLLISYVSIVPTLEPYVDDTNPFPVFLLKHRHAFLPPGYRNATLLTVCGCVPWNQSDASRG